MSLIATSTGLFSDAPATPVDAAIGLTWLPYLLAGSVLVALILAARHWVRGPDAGLVELLVVRVAILVVLGAVVLLLADAASEGDGVTAVDRPVWSWLVNHRTGALTVLARVITEAGSTAVMGAVAVLSAGWLFFRLRRRGDAVLVATVAAGAGLLVSLAKPIVGRVRPPEELRLVTETNASFPSGHALASIAVIGVLYVVFLPCLRSPGWRLAAAAGASLAVLAIGVSRLYLGVHWPTDVIGGWLTGAAWLLVCLTWRTVWEYRSKATLKSCESLPAHPSAASDATDRKSPRI